MQDHLRSHKFPFQLYQTCMI